ncbi:His Kinase A (phospho-acceptor) domain-containing protein [Desulfuromusa kysingii]|uniref:histidine kinase n=1 Tax=Desulfuromusa kysingii TaxID=37625 RepID=A0A1H4DCS7_9BACT|nr:ATP-binding protein [Desulfuromusa kysingii]SEA70209.1 His Kinase A (phospho-acceptor) domain-containing protein [Desulfuromusa kysingii]
MQLKTKLILLISLVICISYGITFYRTSSFQEELVVQQATRQAKMLFNQIRLTRQWVSDHNGLFLVKTSGVESNPFLEDGEIQDDQGHWLVKRNPAMVTRELSLYAAKEGMGQFNVTSLQPMNPVNAPDAFERRSLLKFAQGLPEAVEIEQLGGSYRLRYMAPLIVDSQCLVCHDQQGYALGDIRGGMNVTVPMDWAYAEIKGNNRMLLWIALATIVIVSLSIYLLFNFLVAKRLSLLAAAMDGYPQQSFPTVAERNDEIGVLSQHFQRLCNRLETSQKDLDVSREQVFQSEKQAALGRLVAGIAHEINNPLGGMQNCIQTMQRNMDRPELQVRYMAMLGQGTEKIKGIVQKLLNIGRKEPLEVSKGDVDQVIRDCLELSCVGHKNIQTNLDLGINQLVTTGIESLRQVIMNLAGNAVQAIGAHEGEIRVSSHLDDEKIFIELSDTGPGIKPEYLDKIFEPFFTTKQVGDGTGLGLSVSAALINQLGGSIAVKNRPAGGACFTLQIPVAGHSLLKGDE